MILKHGTENCRELPPLDNHKCFGCSPRNPSGLRMKFYTNDKSLFSSLTVPDHLCGWDRFVHGGVIATILDEIMSWSAITLLKRIILTKSMTIDFVKPIFIGNRLTAEGKVLER
ncbi:MAG: PaaI family thioesterase, partial [Proteobacteria bacterium]|nr:PaaI family thioesterase [Pseudomonadota bacterium]